MKIAFIGDSITEGVPGVSYVDMIKEQTDYVIYNYGKGGDTIRSINKRLKKLYLDDVDKIFFFVGVNEVYSQLNMQNKILKVLLNQTPETNLDIFQLRYIDAVKFLLTKCRDVVLVTPAFMGEDYNNKWNIMLKEYVDVIVDIANIHSLECINLYDLFRNELCNQKVSNYLPYKIMSVRNDTLIKDAISIDKVSKERNLLFSLDGVHMNSKGARKICDLLHKRI